MNKILLVMTLLLGLLVGCNGQLKDTSAKITTTITEQIEKGVEKIPELMVHQKMNWMISPLILGAGAGVLLLFCGVRVIGIGVITASLSCLFLILTITVYMKWIALVGLIALLLGLFFVFKYVYDQHSVNKELVGSMTMAKSFIPAENKDKLKISLNNIQGKVTRNVVNKIKKG